LSRGSAAGADNAAMPRHILPEERLHPAIRERVASLHADVVATVKTAIDAHPAVVVGMAFNPFCKRARRALQAAGVAHEYLEYGSYLSDWRRRNALKLWTGWPTFPMVFVRGQLVGGAQDLEALIASGELQALLRAG
jgi:glutaredoxin-related protein